MESRRGKGRQNPWFGRRQMCQDGDDQGSPFTGEAKRSMKTYYNLINLDGRCECILYFFLISFNSLFHVYYNKNNKINF